MNRDYDRIELDEKYMATVRQRLAAVDASKAAPKPGQDIPGGDMPGDVTDINEKAISAALTLFPTLQKEIARSIEENPYGRCVISISGGSGSGKTCSAAILAYILNSSGIETYTMSGDNYAHRIPHENDEGRQRVFRHNGVRAVVDSRLAENPKVFQEIMDFQKEENEKGHAEPPAGAEWFDTYVAGGKAALKRHLATPHEQNFNEINDVITAFRDGAREIWMRRMGRDTTAFWYENRDFTKTSVLILEWTLGLSRYLTGIDVPVYIETTPEETYASRIARGRDANARTDLIQAVIEIEQGLLMRDVPRASIISTRDGHVLTLDEWKERHRRT